MEHQLRPPLLEYIADAWLVSNVDQQRLARDVRVAFRELQIDQPQCVFAIVDQDQPLRPEGGHLTRQLAADRAAGAGDDDPPPLDQPSHALAVERHLGPVQQVLDRHRPQLELARTVRRPRGIQRCRAGGTANPHAVPFRLLNQDGERLAGEVWCGDHQRVRQPPLAAQPFQHRGRVPDRAEERVAVDSAPRLA